MEREFEVPDEIRGWNWGAFIFNIWWGIGNHVYLPLFCLIPIVNFVWIFVCGFKGNEWAWRNNPQLDAETFKAIQKTWNRAGRVSFMITVGIIIFYLFVMLSWLFLFSRNQM